MMTDVRVCSVYIEICRYIIVVYCNWYLFYGMVSPMKIHRKMLTIFMFYLFKFIIIINKVGEFCFPLYFCYYYWVFIKLSFFSAFTVTYSNKQMMLYVLISRFILVIFAILFFPFFPMRNWIVYFICSEIGCFFCAPMQIIWQLCVIVNEIYFVNNP